MGVCAYAFRANRRLTLHRPENERRFQLKYGAKDGELHELWQDPTGLQTTLLLGIDPGEGFFVGADPVLHSPTRMFISVEFKDAHAAAAKDGWTAWERVRRDADEVKEVLVGGNAESFLEYVRFERAAAGLDQGHRMLLAQHLELIGGTEGGAVASPAAVPAPAQLHVLEEEFGLSATEILDLIESAPRLKMAARGWVAEDHLVRVLAGVPGVSDCVRVEQDGKPDVLLSYRGKRLSVECKNVLREISKNGFPRVDFQRTRASIGDKCSRYYMPGEFDIVAASLHPVTRAWEFTFKLPTELAPHKSCEGRLASNVLVDGTWRVAQDILEAAL